MNGSTDLLTRIRGLSAGDLRLFKMQLRERFKTMSPSQQSAILGKFRGLGGVTQPIQPQKQPTKADMSLWQRGVSTIGEALKMPSKYIFEPIQKYAIEPFAATVTAPFTPRVAGAEGKGWLGRELEEYRKWQSPRFVKGAVETLPWLATALIPGAQLTTATGLAGALGRVAPRTLLGKAAQLGAKALTPAVLAEKAITYPITKPLEMIGKQIAKRITPKVATGLMPDLQDFDQVVQIATKPDRLRKLASTPAFKGIAEIVGGKSATAITSADKAVVGRAILREEGMLKTATSISRLKALGNQEKIFGQLAENGTLAMGKLKGISPGDLFTYPGRYTNKLTDTQKVWISRLREGNTAVGDLLKRNGIEVKELSFEEGGQWVGRKVLGRTHPDGTVESAFVGAGPGRPGAKLGLEKTRVFKTEAEALNEGFHYIPYDDALALNTQGAYNRVVDKQMTDWLLPQTPYRTTAVSGELYFKGSGKDAVFKLVGEGKGRMSVENAYTEGFLPLRATREDIAGSKASLKQLSTIIEQLQVGKEPVGLMWRGIRESYPEQYQTLYTAVKKGKVGAKVTPEGVIFKPEYTQLDLEGMRYELEGLKDWFHSEPASKLVNLIKKVGWYKGEVENLTISQYKTLTGKTPLANILTADKKHIRWEYALDEVATEMGYKSDEILRTAIQDAGKSLKRIKTLGDELARVRKQPELIIPEAGITEGVAPETLQTLRKFIIGEKDRLAEQWKSVRVPWQIARQKALRTSFEEARIASPAFAGKIFTGPDAKATADTLRKAFTPEFNAALGTINKANAVGRMFALAGDMSVAGIQLLFLAGYKPQIYGKALGGFIKAFFDPEFMAKYVSKNAEVINRHPGLIVAGSTEFTEAMARGGFFTTGLGAKLGKPLAPFTRGFDAALTVAGVDLAKALETRALTAADTAVVDKFINEFRGLSSRARLGVPVGQRQIENAVMLTARYNQAIASLLIDVFKGGLQGQLAREAMAKGVSAVVAMSVAISLAKGESLEQTVDHLNPMSPNFMTWEVAGQRIGPGSKVRSVIALFAQSAKNPESLLKGSMENPVVRFARGLTSPTVSTGIDLLTGKNYAGEPSRDGLPSLTRTVLAENLLPVWVQSVLLEGEGSPMGKALRGATEFVGGRAYPMSPYQQISALRNQLAQTKYGVSWEDLGKQDKGRIKQMQLENTSPELQQLQVKSLEESRYQGTMWNNWNKAVQRLENTYQTGINLAAKEFEQTGGGSQFREKVDGLRSQRGALYAGLKTDPAYSEVYKTFEQPKEGLDKYEQARQMYYKVMFSPVLYDEFGNYKFDDADRVEQALNKKYGFTVRDYVEEYSNTKWKPPEALLVLQETQKLLKPYWDIADQVWAKYSPELKSISDRIGIMGIDTPEGKKLLRQNPTILWARKIIATQKKQIRMRNPQIAQALKMFY